MASWRDVRSVARSLPDVVESRSNEGRLRWSVNDKLFVWERPLRRSDIEALGAAAPRGAIAGVRTDGLEMKEALLAAEPAVFFTTPHFDGYPAVLVRLGKISKAKLQSLIRDAWLARAPKRSADAYLAAAKAVRPSAGSRSSRTSR